MKTLQTTVLGTGNSVPFFLDLNANPFQVSIGCVVNTTGQAATWNVQHCFDYATAYLPSWDGSTNVTWFNNSGIANATANISGNYAFPVVAVRLNVPNSTATTTVTMYLTQADTVPP